ncbi:hypothetical protein ABL78_2869 [Leptomonas seymouri]|uniref:Vta1/callose synthase N-terminal domain-containing protein n=1 Tax=Leptomonas seymouri TaxID=5684 RepID=A0A0N1I8N6_LEPSE|nr:hypothetical protein ABL78_2869 [Leptomonas seymouri]|eukprot:KPI88043.1 hypothetical protein ABL78_2869 [Leptomonas seymouri]
MSSSTALLDKVPEYWAAMVRPFLQRSREFSDKEPLVAYFLRTHVAFLCMKQRKKEKTGTAFLMALLEALEADKAKLGAKLEGVDGRTTLTRFALMLFARADDAERTGGASMTIVRTFYAAAVLFEATGQFTENGEMDSIASEKCSYAKYIAARMKKALDAKETYVSPNTLEQVEGEPDSTATGPNNDFTTVPASCFSQLGTNPPLAAKHDGGEMMPSPSPQPAPTYNSSTPSTRQDLPPPPYTYNLGSPGGNTTPGTPQPATPQHPSTKSSALPPPRPTPASSTSTPSLPAVVTPAMQRQSAQVHSSSSNDNSTAAGLSMNVGGAGGGFKPSVDQMIDAQKLASRAVSALQFYDYENAKKQLVAAMHVLNGVHQ